MFDFPKYNIPILLDSAKQKELDEKGYCVIPFLNEENLNRLNDLYEKIHKIDSSGFFPSTYSNNKIYRKEVSNKLQKSTEQLISENFINYKVFTANFIIKHVGKNTELGLHQDMTLVDESKFMGINVWCPLCDVTPENGAIWVLESSNRLFPTYRGPSIPNIYDDIPHSIASCMNPIYVKAGEAIVFDHSILHFSPPNLSSSDRVAFNVFISNIDSSVITAYFDKEKKEKKIELFDQEKDFFMEFEQFDKDKYERPRIGKSKGFNDYQFPVIKEKLLIEKYGFIKKKKNILHFFKSLFSK